MKKDGRLWHLEWLGEGYEDNIAEAYKTIPKCTSSSDKFVKLIGNVVKNEKQIQEVKKRQEKVGANWAIIVIPKKYYKKTLITSHQHLDFNNKCYYQYGSYYIATLYI